jgi:hypothetical protein
VTASITAWSNQVRVRCCKIFIGNGDVVTCKRCGKTYARAADGTYEESHV